MAQFLSSVFGTSAFLSNKRHSDQVMLEIIDNRHESYTQEPTEHDDEENFGCHESSNGHSKTT
jgi:hypothetical protein